MSLHDNPQSTPDPHEGQHRPGMLDAQESKSICHRTPLEAHGVLVLFEEQRQPTLEYDYHDLAPDERFDS